MSKDAGPPDYLRDAAEILASIREITPTEHVIMAHAWSLLVDDEEMLMRQARVVPDPPGGRGLRVFGVRGDSVLARLGMENGDRVVGLMGLPTRTVDEARPAYAAVRGAPVVTLDVERGGRTLRLTIRVE